MIHYYLSDSNGQPFTRLVVGDGLSAVVETGDDGLAELRIGATGSVTETDPVFAAWLAATPPLFSEADPVFTAWLALPPNISTLTNDAGYVDAAGAVTAVGEIWTPFNLTALSQLTNDSGFITSAGVPTTLSSFTNDAGFLTDISALTAGAVTSLSGHSVSELTNDAGFLTDISALTAGAVTSLSGHSVSELTNDAGYVDAAGAVAAVGAIWTPFNLTALSQLTNDSGFITASFDFKSAIEGEMGDNLAYQGWVEYGYAPYCQQSSGLWGWQGGWGWASLDSAFATAAQGALADSALQSLTGLNVSELTNDAGFLTDISALTAGAVTSLSGHSVSELTNDAGFLTDISALTAGAVTSLSGHNISELTNDANYCTNPMSTITPGDMLYTIWSDTSPGGVINASLPIGTPGQILAAVSGWQNGAGVFPGWIDAPFATAAQGALADTALQPTGDGGALLLTSYNPATPSDWGYNPPSTLAEALDRIAYNLVLAGFTP